MRFPRISSFRWWPAPAAALLLAGCATVGDYGGYPGGSYPGSGYPPATSAQDLVGTVSNVDHNNRRFLVDEDGGRRADIAYDGGTRLVYQGREQAVQGLEPGDRVRVLAAREGSLWRARDIEVLQDGRGGYGDSGSERRGAITYVDTRAREIGFNDGGYSGPAERASYDAYTVVEYRGQRYPVDALERGDQVRMRLRRGDRGWVAERIVVEVSVRER